MWQQWINVVLGLWVIALPFIGITAAGMTWALAISGIIIAGLGLWGAWETNSERHSGVMAHRTS